MNEPPRDTTASRDPAFWKRPVEQWMWDASYQIDYEVGLPRFDLAISVTAHLIAKYYWEAKERTDGSRPEP